MFIYLIFLLSCIKSEVNITLYQTLTESTNLNSFIDISSNKTLVVGGEDYVVYIYFYNSNNTF